MAGDVQAARQLARGLAGPVAHGEARGEFAHAAQHHAMTLDCEATLDTFGDLPLLGHDERGLPIAGEWSRRVEN